MLNKPELLLPVGSIPSFYAAIEGGADAVFLGLPQFNARQRAANFSSTQLIQLVAEAQKKQIRVYITLNTSIKNNELPLLVDTLYFLSQLAIHGVIIQDWGVYYLVKKYFPTIVLHASTQLGIHNSIGANHCKHLGFQRVIPARELTATELTTIRKKTTIELEVFTHGALCYSFSGMCLFSSYLGGSSANRGNCAQPCRRTYKTQNTPTLLFNLKDNQLIDHVRTLSDMGINSFKIEGRMKSAEYVYQVAKAYRSAIDQQVINHQAKHLLAFDMGREKTAYFMGGNVSNSLSQIAGTGIFLGKIEAMNGKTFTVHTHIALKQGDKIRIRTGNDLEEKSGSILNTKKEGDKQHITLDGLSLCIGDSVYLTSTLQKRFPSAFQESAQKIATEMPFKQKSAILGSFNYKPNSPKAALFLRIDSLSWLEHIDFSLYTNVLVALSKKELTQLIHTPPIGWDTYKHLICIELPKFISEKQGNSYKSYITQLHEKGVGGFAISHLSQYTLLPPKAFCLTTENVYLFNDAAVACLKSQGIHTYISPQENEYENLLRGKDRHAIIPIYFYPELFFSRMPIRLDNTNTFYDSNKNTYLKKVKDGITTVIPKEPVCLLQYIEKLKGKQFHRFLIDLSHTTTSPETYKRITQAFKQGEKLEKTSSFNFKKGLR